MNYKINNNMMKKIFYHYSFLICCALLFSAIHTKSFSKDLKITSMELGYPVPAIPFYHFKAELELDEPSIIELKAAVNGDTLRFVNLYKDHSEEDLDKPPFVHRPPSGYALSQDNTLYKKPVITGWLRWQPGEEYEIEITVRLKESAQPSEDDEFVSASAKVTAPSEGDFFDEQWKSYKSVVLSETAGIDRTKEAVEVLLPFYPDEVNDLKREIRVMAVDTENHTLTEVPSQIFDIREYEEEDDLAPLEEGGHQRTIPLWMPTVSCKVAFLADVPAKSSKVYLIYYNNADAMAKTYHSDLRVQGELPGLRIDNNYFNAVLHPRVRFFTAWKPTAPFTGTPEFMFLPGPGPTRLTGSRTRICVPSQGRCWQPVNSGVRCVKSLKSMLRYAMIFSRMSPISSAPQT